MEKKNNYAVPMAIIIAGALIAAALYFVQSGAGTSAGVQLPTADTTQQQELTPVPGIQSDDYVLGNRDAKLVIVEYSDLECPFCKHFQESMHQVLEAFPNDVAWVYRQFPLTSLHSQAVAESVASECVGTLGGNEAFWKFIDKIYEVTPSNNGLDLSKIPEYAAEAGVTDTDALSACMQDPDTLALVQADLDAAIASGGQGTPYGIIIYKDQQLKLPGAVPFDDYQAGGQTQPGLKSMIESVLQQ